MTGRHITSKTLLVFPVLFLAFLFSTSSTTTAGESGEVKGCLAHQLGCAVGQVCHCLQLQRDCAHGPIPTLLAEHSKSSVEGHAERPEGVTPRPLMTLSGHSAAPC